MKKILLLIFILPFLAHAQSDWKKLREYNRQVQAAADTTIFPDPFEFTYIDSTITLPKQQLYSKIYQWLATYIRNLNFGTTMQDSSSGKIVIPKITCTGNSDVRYALTIDVRDHKFRYAVTGVEYHHGSPPYDNWEPIEVGEKEKMVMIGGTKKKYWSKLKYETMMEFQAGFESVKQFISKIDNF